MSFVELEGVFRKVEREKDAEYLKLLDHELGFRNKNSKTPALKAKVAKAIAKIPARQEDFFEATSPPKATKSAGAKKSTVHSKPSVRTKSKFKPTDEQKVALDAFLAGSSLKINAFAGTGKTSTLQLLSNATGSKGQYIAFNRNIVGDAKEKFADTVDCSTSHSLAFRAAPSGYKADIGKMTNKCSAKLLVEAFEFASCTRSA